MFTDCTVNTNSQTAKNQAESRCSLCTVQTDAESGNAVNQDPNTTGPQYHSTNMLSLCCRKIQYLFYGIYDHDLSGLTIDIE